MFQVDLYTREQWLEIMPKAASKASAALWLKSSLGCGRLVVFGDGENDVDLFEMCIRDRLDTMGIDPATLDAYAFSMSMMNVRAYAIGVFKPAEGQAEAVQAAVESYVSLQRKSFENYLADQYEVAKGALIKTLPGGEIVLVMSEGAADIMANLEKTLK